MLKRLLSLLCAALWAAPLAASEDWLALAVPRPLSGDWELSLGLQQAQRESWAHGTGHPLLKDAQGQKVQRVLQGDLGLRWQAGAHGSLWTRVPLVFSELALWTGGISSPRVDDSSVARDQGLGDISVGWRQDWGAAKGAAFGWGLGLVAPTGLGPWEATHPLAGTGEGRWQGLLRLSAGLAGEAVSLFAGATGRLQGGREAVLSSAAPVLYDAAGPRTLPAGSSGNAYLDPRWGAEGALGLGWDWFRGDTDRHSLSLSVCARHLSPLSVSGKAVDETASLLAWVQPELQARFGRFEARAAWLSPAFLDDNTAVPYWGELHFRLDHAF